MSSFLMRSIVYGAGFYAGCAAVSAAPLTAPAAYTSAWQTCSAITANEERLACFDQWAASAVPTATNTSMAAIGTVPAASALTTPTVTADAAAPAKAAQAHTASLNLPSNSCYNQAYGSMLRFYELRRDTDCGTFRLRGYQPQSVSLTQSNHINTQPSTPTQPTPDAEDYQTKEMRLQFSLRTKMASGLLTPEDSDRLDSLWIAYSQLSFWQVFNGDISRPFRTTDHQPEIFYIYPTEAKLPFGWRWRYSGIGLIHHSNGQSDPLSRSWNRAYLMAGAELNDRWQLQGKVWHRISERIADDDNPGIQNYWGRGELKLFWMPNQDNIFGVTARGSIGKGYGSGRLEWLRTIGHNSNLRLHVQLFSGYGESLIDYNYKRTSLSVGLSLLDF